MNGREEVECPSCNGKGVYIAVSGTEKECAVCDGTGRTTRDNAEGWYAQESAS